MDPDSEASPQTVEDVDEDVWECVDDEEEEDLSTCNPASEKAKLLKEDILTKINSAQSSSPPSQPSPDSSASTVFSRWFAPVTSLIWGSSEPSISKAPENPTPVVTEPSPPSSRSPSPSQTQDSNSTKQEPKTEQPESPESPRATTDYLEKQEKTQAQSAEEMIKLVEKLREDKEFMKTFVEVMVHSQAQVHPQYQPVIYPSPTHPSPVYGHPPSVGGVSSVPVHSNTIPIFVPPTPPHQPPTGILIQSPGESASVPVISSGVPLPDQSSSASPPPPPPMMSSGPSPPPLPMASGGGPPPPPPPPMGMVPKKTAAKKDKKEDPVEELARAMFDIKTYIMETDSIADDTKPVIFEKIDQKYNHLENLQLVKIASKFYKQVFTRKAFLNLKIFDIIILCEENFITKVEEKYHAKYRESASFALASMDFAPFSKRGLSVKERKKALEDMVLKFCSEQLAAAQKTIQAQKAAEAMSGIQTQMKDELEGKLKQKRQAEEELERQKARAETMSWLEEDEEEEEAEETEDD